MVAVVIRSLERVLIILAGILSIYLGYHLFLQNPNEVNSQGHVTLPGGTAIYLSRVGPGAFLALFGAIVVAISFLRPIKYDEVEKMMTDIQYEKDELEKSKSHLQREKDELEKSKRDIEYVKSRGFVGFGPSIDIQDLDLGRREERASGTESRSSVTNRSESGPSGSPIDKGDLSLERQLMRENILDQLPLLVSTNLSNAQKRERDNLIEKIKLALIKSVWDSDWGNVRDFEVWANNQAPEPVPNEVKKEAADYYKGMHTDS